VTLALSIVSHGHGAQVLSLLALLAQSPQGLVRRVWVTLNTSEPALAQALAAPGAAWRDRLEVRVLHNPRPLGFGANHNQAFGHEQQQSAPAPFFVVMNPDITWPQEPWAAMLQAAAQPGVGCVYPQQVDAHGQPQDHARRLPTPGALLQRYLGGAARRRARVSAPDWANAALLLFHSAAYQRIQGFDEAYYMYCEDVDICLRLQLAGYRLAEAHGACVVHAGQRASHRHWRHLGWHLRSLWRLWHSPAYREFQQDHGRRAG